MHRFFQHCRSYLVLPQEAEAFLASHGEVCHYARGEFFMRADERKPYWCVVLEGLVCGYTLDQAGRRRIHWFATPMQGFAGVRHLYTPRPSAHYIQFVEVSVVWRIRASKMREAKERFAEMSELLHVMNQRYKDRQDMLIEVLQQPSAYERYTKFLDSFPELANRIEPEQERDFINIARTTYYRVLNRYLDERRKKRE